VVIILVQLNFIAQFVLTYTIVKGLDLVLVGAGKSLLEKAAGQ